MLRKKSFLGRRAFAYTCIFVMIFIYFQSPLVKALDTTTEFDALFPAQTIPGTDVTIENNLNNVSEISTELAVWESDLGSGITEGSYVGPIFESSLFEVDYKPYLENETLSYTDKMWRDVDAPRIVLAGALANSTWLPLNTDGTVTMPHQYFPRHFDVSADNQETFTSYFPVAKKRSIITLAMNMTFTNRMILSGATEFYVRIPIDASCINIEELRPTLSFFELSSAYDPDKLWMVDGYTIVYDPWTKRTVLDEYGNIDVIDTNAGEIRPEYSSAVTLRSEYDGQGANIIQYITDDDVVNNHIYSHVRGTIEPNTEYLVVFSAILSSKPKVYLTEDDICSNGRQSMIQVADLNFEYVTQRTIRETGVEATFFEHYLTVVSSELVSGYPEEFIGPRLPFARALINETMPMPVDMSFSFVFKNGRGDFGMFGHKYHFDTNDAFMFYKEIEERPETDQFISIMVPIISEDWIDINITVELLPKWKLFNRFEPRGVLGRHSDIRYYNETAREFGYTYTNWWQAPENKTYTDYILFSVPYKIDEDKMTDNIWAKILISFNRPANITFMFSTLPDSAYNEYLMDRISYGTRDVTVDSQADAFPFYIRQRLFYVIRDTISRPMGTFIWENRSGLYDADNPIQDQFYYEYSMRMPLRQDNLEIAHYELFASVQLTDGIWHELVTSPEGFQYATHFFERRIAVGVIDLWIDTTNNETVEQHQWYDESAGYWEMAMESFGRFDIIGGIKNVVMAGISFIWNGLKAFLGVIIGVFKKTWDVLVGVGKFIVGHVMSFIGTIVSIIGDIVDAAERILSVAIYIIAILIFMYVVSWGGKLIYLSRLSI